MLVYSAVYSVQYIMYRTLKRNEHHVEFFNFKPGEITARL